MLFSVHRDTEYLYFIFVEENFIVGIIAFTGQCTEINNRIHTEGDWVER